MNPGFEAEEVKVFGAMYKKGYIYKGLKPVYWCYHDETALAEAEIEYQDDPCTCLLYTSYWRRLPSRLPPWPRCRGRFPCRRACRAPARRPR